MDAGHACSLLSGFDITIAGFMNTNGSDASAAIARISCDDVVHLLSLHVCLHLSSDADIEMEPRAGSPPLVILTTPSRAIPAPLVGLCSSDKCSSTLPPPPPDHLDRRRATRIRRRGIDPSNPVHGGPQIWCGLHIWSN